MEEQHFNSTPQASGKAIASLVLGILSIIIPWIGFVLGIIAIVLANKAFKEIAHYQLGGRGMAVAGLTTGIVGTAIYGLMLLLFIIGIATFNGMYY
ncbi:hypothetical protein BN1058_00671 [Paraliobacillus sp. PM-2]|uniref:DUF4190 domain-containing protein n=1 Tax=Paraliobacillus sp. PM-2 TaxID=1462524 RepID=UPI00061C1DF8|nr:DUF4190 domain-containing protein [Paraliobacillus sp. PM-2]CQR46411.1 hypothetical protein BN1058_00671 [Paraliobacillus sp. PM-2]